MHHPDDSGQAVCLPPLISGLMMLSFIAVAVADLPITDAWQLCVCVSVRDGKYLTSTVATMTQVATVQAVLNNREQPES